MFNLMIYRQPASRVNPFSKMESIQQNGNLFSKMEIYSAKFYSAKFYSAKLKSIQQNWNLFSKTEIYSAKLKSIQQNWNLFSKTEIYSAKLKSIQQNGNLFSKTGIYSAKRRGGWRPNGNLFSQMGISIQLNNGWRPKLGAIWPNHGTMVPHLRHPFLSLWVGWGAACTSLLPIVIMHEDSHAGYSCFDSGSLPRGGSSTQQLGQQWTLRHCAHQDKLRARIFPAAIIAANNSQQTEWLTPRSEEPHGDKRQATRGARKTKESFHL